MPILETLHGGRVPVHAWTGDIEASARQQLANIARLPIVHHHVAAMPDVHTGIGATVGSVIATRSAIIPAAVGVDIGCGMIAARTTLRADDLDERRLRKVFGQISHDVPVGREQHRGSAVPEAAARPFAAGLMRICQRHPALRKGVASFDNWIAQLGTLGGGNHFIEVCLDEADRVWVMLHSGSRGVGNRIGNYFIARAREAMLREDAHLPDADLAWLAEGTPLFDDYVDAVDWAQGYARENRRLMMELVLAALARHLPPFELTSAAVNCHHNYVARERHYGAEVWVTRKGAIRAGEGELGIIPGSMGTRSYIVRGKGSAESFCSCAHGAGRRMSRTQARKVFKPSDLERQTAGVLCRKDAGVVDEIPGAYKDIDRVMANQADLVEVVHALRQVVCVKG